MVEASSSFPSVPSPPLGWECEPVRLCLIVLNKGDIVIRLKPIKVFPLRKTLRSNSRAAGINAPERLLKGANH